MILFVLAGCANLSEPFDLPDPKDATITVTVRYPDERLLTYRLRNFSPLSELLKQIDCPECDLSQLNPQTVLKDKDTIVLRTLATFSVSLNQGTLEDLMRLPGIGESLAQRIIEYRTSFGFFQKIEDVMRIKGIKQGLFDKIKAYIRL